MVKKLAYLKKELVKINKSLEIDNLNEEVITFLYQSLIAKKGYILIYHESVFKQNYKFDFNPMIILSLQKFEELKHIFVFQVEYKVVPLLLADGHYYKKLKSMTNLNVGFPLLHDIEDIKYLVKICRKSNRTNIWVMHPTRQKELMDNIKKTVDKDDIVLTIDDKYDFVDGKDYHVIVLLMSKGNHYHQLVESLPEHISVPDILPHIYEVKKWIEERNN